MEFPNTVQREVEELKVIFKEGEHMKFFALIILFSVSLLFSQSSYDFVILGDRTGDCQYDIYSQFVDNVAKLKTVPAFCADVGDHIEGYTKDTAKLTEQYEEFRKQLKPVTNKMAWHYVTGNHDITHLSVRTWFADHFGPRYYSFDYGPDHFLMVDNSEGDGKIFLKDTVQMAFIKNDLKKNSAKRFRFVFYHKPGWGYSVDEPSLDSLHSLWKSLKVNFIFNGHFHNYREGIRDGIRYVTVGSSGGQANNLSRDASFYQALRVFVTEKGMDFRFMLDDGSELLRDVTSWRKNTRFVLQDTLSLSGASTDTLLESNYRDSTRIPFVLRLSNPTSETLLVSIRPMVFPEPSYKMAPAFPETLRLMPGTKRIFTSMARKDPSAVPPVLKVQMQTLPGRVRLWYTGDVTLNVKRALNAYSVSSAVNEWEVLFNRTQKDPAHWALVPGNPYDTSWIAFSYDKKALMCHFKCFDPHPDSLRLGIRSRDEEMKDNIDHFRLFLASDGNEHTPLYNICVTPDGMLRDFKTVYFPVHKDSLEWNGAEAMDVKKMADGYGGTIRIPWSALNMAGPADFVFNLRCGSSRFTKKFLRIAYQEPFEKNPSACALAKIIK